MTTIHNPRMTARITTAFVLRQISTIADLFDGDLILGLVFFGVGAANNRLILQNRDFIEGGATVDDGLAGDYRRPVSVSALARSLGLPFETTRRYVRKLIDQGMCVQTDAGLMVSDEARTSDRVTLAVRRNNIDVKWFIMMLRSGCVSLEDPAPAAWPDGDAPAAQSAEDSRTNR